MPWPVLILAVDPGNTSGWAGYLHGEYLESGELDTRRRADVDELAGVTVSLASELGVRAVLVLEHHPWLGHGRRTAAALEGSKRTWRDSWRAAGGSDARVVLAPVSTWRSRLFGGRLRTAEAQAREQATARGIAHRDCGPDESAAVCIGHWATRAEHVGRKLPRTIIETALGRVEGLPGSG